MTNEKTSVFGFTTRKNVIAFFENDKRMANEAKKKEKRKESSKEKNKRKK